MYGRIFLSVHWFARRSREYYLGVWEKEKSYVPEYMVEEMEGIATGLCAKLDLITPNPGETVAPSLACNVTEWTDKIQQLNMLPELIRMACTAYGD